MRNFLSSLVARDSGLLLAKLRGMTLKQPVLAVLLILIMSVCVACDGELCESPNEDLSVQLGYAGMGEWTPIEQGDEILVSPGSQGWGLMVEVNIRIAGLAADLGAYSTASVHLVRMSESSELLTAPGTRMLAALCQEDGALMSRNRRVEFGEDYMLFEELEGIDDGFDALLRIEVEFQDGTQIEQQLEVHLYRDEPVGGEEVL